MASPVFDKNPDPRPPLAPLVGRHPERGAAPAAKNVLQDVQNLVKAEVDLAKAEATEAIKQKAIGAGFFIGAAIFGWLALQALLIWIGFVFALFLPPWAASGLVLLLLVIIVGILGFLGLRKMEADASLARTKETVETSKVAVTSAVDEAKVNLEEGIAEATGTTKSAFSRLISQIKGSQIEGRDHKDTSGR